MATWQQKRLWAFVFAVDGAGLVVLATLPTVGLVEFPGTALLLAALTLLAGARPVHISILRTEVTATHPFIFCAVAALGPYAAALVALTGVVGATFGHKTQRRGIHLAFNLGAVVLSTALASWTFLLMGGTPGDRVLFLLWPLTAASVAYFITNTGLVAMAIALEKGQPIITTWKRSVQWTTVSSFAGLTLAVGLLVILQTLGPWGLALGIPPSWLLAAFYRANKERREEQQKRIDEIERLNESLERRVEERTSDLQQALARIEELQTLKATLTETLIHDLKNPLTAFLGNLDLMELQAEARTLKLVQRSKEGASRLLRMILDLLDISRLEEGRFLLERESIDAHELTRKAVENAEATALQSQVRLEVKSCGDIRPVRADASMVQRVLDNLLANALQYSSPDGTVTVSIAARENGVEIAVADEGPGILPEYRAKVFEKYAQVELRRGGVSTNRGLGLTFCQLAVEAHGGTIQVEAAPTGGALFRVFLPEKEAEKVEVESGSSECRESSSTDALDAQDREADTDAKTILVVDDEPLVAELIRDLVEADGHNCLVAGDADEADRILAGNRVDGITLDMVMPGRNGLDWLETLAAETPELARRTLFITGSRLGPVECQRLDRCGAVLFTKPFDHQCVIEALRSRLGLG